MGDHEQGGPHGEGDRLPSTTERWPDPDGAWLLTLDWQIIDGRPECVGYHFISTGDAQLPDVGVAFTTGLQRDLRLGERIGRERAGFAAQMSTPGPRGMRLSARRRLETAATIYREAFAAGQPPTKAVAEHFGITQGGASSLVARAREAGLLPPTSPGAPQG